MAQEPLATKGNFLTSDFRVAAGQGRVHPPFEEFDYSD